MAEHSNTWSRIVGGLSAVAVLLGGGVAGLASTAHALVPVSSVSPTRPLAPLAQGITSPQGVGGTTAADIASFAAAFNATRLANELEPVELSHFRYDACMEQRLFWIAEDPSTNITSAWGHIGTRRSDGLPSVGCDGNLAGGMNDTGARVAVKWWNSLPHRDALYKPPYVASMSTVCIYFAMTHGGVPDEPIAFTRAAARWSTC